LKKSIRGRHIVAHGGQICDAYEGLEEKCILLRVFERVVKSPGKSSTANAEYTETIVQSLTVTCFTEGLEGIGYIGACDGRAVNGVELCEEVRPGCIVPEQGDRLQPAHSVTQGASFRCGICFERFVGIRD